MGDYIGKICPFCKTEITAEDAVMVCPACGIAHHQGCWNDNKGCTTFGCSEQHYEEQGTNPTAVCSNCGATLGDGQEFCPSCGTAKGPFCANCGQKTDFVIEESVSSAINTFNASVQKSAVTPDQKKKFMVIGGIAVALIIILVLIFSGGTKDFNDMFPQYRNMSWCDIASDGSYMKIDTNPYNEDSDDFDSYYYKTYFTPANDAVDEVNRVLGFSEALSEKMNTTTWSQGKQYESNGKYDVSWTYHPDKGLEVMYEIAD